MRNKTYKTYKEQQTCFTAIEHTNEKERSFKSMNAVVTAVTISCMHQVNDTMNCILNSRYAVRK